MLNDKNGMGARSGRRVLTPRLLVGIAIEASGLALLLTMIGLWMMGASFTPVAILVTVFGTGSTVLVIGGVMVLALHRPASGSGLGNRPHISGE